MTYDQWSYDHNYDWWSSQNGDMTCHFPSLLNKMQADIMIALASIMEHVHSRSAKFIFYRIVDIIIASCFEIN